MSKSIVLLIFKENFQLGIKVNIPANFEHEIRPLFFSAFFKKNAP